MSMGAWILVAFSGCAFLAAVSNEVDRARLWISDGDGAWLDWGSLGRDNRASTCQLHRCVAWRYRDSCLVYPSDDSFPPIFLPLALGAHPRSWNCAGFLIPATQVLGFITAGLQIVFETLFVIRRPDVDAPLHEGRSGIAFRIAGLLEGPTALLVRIIWGSLPGGRCVAAICFLAGSLLSRYAWVWAGRESAKRSDVQFALQRSEKR